MYTLANSAGGVAGAIFGILGYIILVAAYWVPSIVAWRRRVPNLGSIIVINVFGFLFFTWIIALAMACRSRPDQVDSAASTSLR